MQRGVEKFTAARFGAQCLHATFGVDIWLVASWLYFCLVIGGGRCMLTNLLWVKHRYPKWMVNGAKDYLRSLVSF